MPIADADTFDHLIDLACKLPRDEPLGITRSEWSMLVRVLDLNWPAWRPPSPEFRFCGRRLALIPAHWRDLCEPRGAA